MVNKGDTFSCETVRLLSDVNMGGREVLDDQGKLKFYPIGYTHDYQFSRIAHSDLNFADSNGNGRVDTGEVPSVTGCEHDHAAAGKEVIDGTEVLKEDKQAVHIPFYQLFGGYGWGVDGVDLEEYNNLQIEIDRKITTGPEESVDKFLARDGVTELESGKTYQLGELFCAADGADIQNDAVTVGMTDLNPDNDSTVTMVYESDADDWTKGTVTFTGKETIEITIQDYHFCNHAKLTVMVAEKQTVVTRQVRSLPNVITDQSESSWAGKMISIVGDSISTGGYPGILEGMTGATIQKLAVSGMKLAGGLTGKVTDVD